MKWTWVADMPSTNVRIAMTIVLIFGTGCKVIATGWTPSLEWLGFLLAMAGVDTAQFWAKRATYKPLEAPAEAAG